MTQRATFAAGCFWGVESTFRRIPGVTATRVGYTGGHTDDPSYYDVCSDTTGHAEAVEIEFDPEQVSYEELLAVFFANHDPTHAEPAGPGRRQPVPVGRLLPLTRAGGAGAEGEGGDPGGSCPSPSSTEVVPAETFYAAEDYHQQYFEKMGRSSCHAGLKTAATA